jgi:hypothetical protein
MAPKKRKAGKKKAAKKKKSTKKRARPVGSHIVRLPQ